MVLPKRRAVFLDRDGVLNQPEFRDGRSFAPRTLDEFVLYPEAAAVLAKLRDAGFLLVVVTNQPDVGNGLVDESVVLAMHKRLAAELPVDAIEMSYATREKPDRRRKPAPGMLIDAARRLNIELSLSYIVGDRASDIACGRAVGCRTIFIDHDYSAEVSPACPDFVCRDVGEAAGWIISDKVRGHRQSMTVSDLRIKLFADGADLDGILEMYADPKIEGFTTNPTLMRKSGISDYEGFARTLLEKVTDRPVSLEVFADDLPEMERQARKIAAWGSNVNVKIPVTTTSGESTAPILSSLSADGVVLNVTAIMTLDQVEHVAEALSPETPAIISVFAGRVADTGIDPVPHMAQALALLDGRPKAELLWASPRELLNVFQADQIGCHIITATNDILKKLSLVGKDLDAYSRETVQMFRNDALAAGFEIQ